MFDECRLTFFSTAIERERRPDDEREAALNEALARVQRAPVR
jgi:hypothetical protein